MDGVARRRLTARPPAWVSTVSSPLSRDVAVYDDALFHPDGADVAPPSSRVAVDRPTRSTGPRRALLARAVDRSRPTSPCTSPGSPSSSSGLCQSTGCRCRRRCHDRVARSSSSTRASRAGTGTWRGDGRCASACNPPTRLDSLDSGRPDVTGEVPCPASTPLRHRPRRQLQLTAVHRRFTGPPQCRGGAEVRGRGLPTGAGATVVGAPGRAGLPGEEPTPLQRVAAASDFGNGVSSELDFAQYVFINPDLTVYLHRPAVGEWVCLDASTRSASRCRSRPVPSVGRAGTDRARATEPPRRKRV